MNDIESVLREYASRVDAALQQWLDGIGLPYLSEPLRYHFGSGGKRLRPALCLYVCEQLGGSLDKAVPFALAVEILHNMFLLHDDIEDGDTMRRDQPTVWVKFGTPNAVNAGDYLLASAQRLAASADLPAETNLRLSRILTDAALRTIEGQALDINLRAAERFKVEDYLRIARLKTGRYLVLGMAGAAVISGASEEVIETLWGLGENMGPAFQIRDDIIDLTQGKGRGGEVGCDIREGKPSILYAHCLNQCTPGERAHLIEVFRAPREQTSAEDVQSVMALYQRCGSIAFAQQKADALIDQAFAVIDRLPLGNKAVFRQVAAFMAKRTA